MTTSVIIITRNRAKSLVNCLRSIEKQSVLPSEVIIIDNASVDETKEVVEKFSKTLNLRYLYQPIVSISISRNAGIALAKGDVLLITDDDCVATRNWIKNTIASHLKHPHAVAIQGRVISIPKESLYSLILQKQREVRITMSRVTPSGILYLGTDNASIKKIFLEHMEISFHETIRYTGDDMDVAAQIFTKKGVILFDKDILVFHKERKNLKDFLLQRYRNGAVPIVLKRRWPNLRFHFYHSTLLKHTKTYININVYLLKKKRCIDFIRLPFVLLLAIIIFEISGVIQRFKKD